MIKNTYALKSELNVKHTAKQLSTIYYGQTDKEVEEDVGFPVAMVLFTDQMSFVEFCKDAPNDIELLIVLLYEYAKQLEESIVKDGEEVCQEN